MAKVGDTFKVNITIGGKAFSCTFKILEEPSGSNHGKVQFGNDSKEFSTNPTGELVIPETVSYDGKTYDVTSIGKYAFYWCSELTGDLTIPDSVTSIGDYAFSNCSAFNGILTISSNITSIGSHAFYGCSGFRYAIIKSSNAPSLGDYALDTNNYSFIIYYPYNGTGYDTGNWNFYKNKYLMKADKESTPNATFAATGEDSGKLSNVSTSMKYSLDGGTTWNPITSKNMVITGVTDTNGVKIYTPGDGVSKDSDVQIIKITKAAKPTTIGKVGCTTLSNNNGKITGVTSNMEYKLSADSNWTSCSDGEITGLKNGTYYVRVKANGTTLASEYVTIMINEYIPKKEQKPSAQFTATCEDGGTLSNVTTAMNYSLDGGNTWNPITGNTMYITGVTEANGIKIYQPGDKIYTIDSDVQTITIIKASTPTAVGKEDCTTLANNDGKITSVTTDMEYKLSTNAGWISITGNEVTGLKNGTYYVRVKANGTTLASEYVTIMINEYIPYKEPTPNANFTATGPDTGVLSGVTAGMKYKIGNGNWIDITASDDIKLTGLSACTISVIKLGDGIYTIDSDIQTIIVTKAATPTTVGKEDCTTLANNDGKITGVTTDMEYKLSTDSIWIPCSDGEIIRLRDGTYYVRIKANGNSLASEYVTLIIAEYKGYKEPTPQAIFTATGPDTGILSGVSSGMKYRIENGNWIDITASDDIKLTGLSACTISVIKTGDGIYTIDSDIQMIIVTKAAKPTTIGKVDCKTLANDNGKITGVTSEMEYKLSTDSSWISINSNEITGLKNGTYHVRVKANGTTLASDMQIITIFPYSGIVIILKEETPTAKFTATGPDTGILSGVNSGMKYRIENGSWIDINSGNNITLNGLSECTISVVRKGNNFTSIDSDTQTIKVTKADEPTTVGKVDCTTPANNDGKLIGVTTSMEYKLSTASFWISGTGNDITGLSSGTYYVRIKANGTMLASEAQIIIIGAYIEPITEIQNGGSITGENLDKLISGGKTLTVYGDKGIKLVFNTNALKEIGEKTSGEIRIEVKDVSNEHQTSLQGKKVFSLKVSSGNETISNYGGTITVTLPYELKDGENAWDVTVWYLSSDGAMIEIPVTYDPVTNVVTFTVTNLDTYVIGVKEPEPEPESEHWINPFTDVKENDWFYEAVKFVVQNGLFAGTGSSTFSPNNPMTRAMLWTVLGRLAGHNFTGSNVFEDARIWAINVGITDGSNPNGNITREQMITILWRYAGSPKASGDLNKFSDGNSVSGYAAEAMAWAVENGIIAGANGALMPKENATRAQVAAILERFIKVISKQ